MGAELNIRQPDRVPNKHKTQNMIQCAIRATHSGLHEKGGDGGVVQCGGPPGAHVRDQAPHELPEPPTCRQPLPQALQDPPSGVLIAVLLTRDAAGFLC